MIGPRFSARPVSDEAHVVVDGASGEEIARLMHGSDAYWLAALLDALSSGACAEDVLLGIGEHRRFLRRITLRHAAVCFRCGRTMRPGSPAFWHPVSRVIRHVGSCRKAELQDKRRRRSAR